MNTKENYEAVVIGGGGVKLFLSLGFLDFVESKIKSVKYYAGTSSGAILAFLLSIGYTPKEIMTYVCSNDIFKLLNDMSLLNLPLDFGLINNKLGIRYLELMALKKLNYIPTFNDIYTKLGIFFMCPAYNLNGNSKEESEVYFSPLTHGDMNVCDAVVYSCTVPIVFTKSEYKNNLYIDGGFFDMCPLDKLVNMCGIQDKNILCLLYKNKFENTEIRSVFDYAKKVFSNIIKKYSMTFKSDKLDTIQINSDIQTLDFSMSVKDRIKFFTEGKKQAEEYFSTDHPNLSQTSVPSSGTQKEENSLSALPREDQLSVSHTPTMSRRDSEEQSKTTTESDILSEKNKKKSDINEKIEQNKID